MAYAMSANIPVLNSAGDAVPKLARTTTGNSGWLDIADATDIIAQLDSSAGTGITPTLDVKFQTSFNANDTTAIDVLTGAFTQVTSAASAQLKVLNAFHRYIKIVWTIAGTTPSFNFGVYITTK